MKKNHVIRLLKMIFITVPLIVIFFFLQENCFFHFDNHKVRMEGFYQEPKNSLDVVLLGSSEVYTGFSSVEAYKQYGFTSYPYAIAANPASMIKYQIKEILNNQTPQLIVIEVNSFVGGDHQLSDEGKIRRYIDNIPMSMNRIDSIMEFDYDDKISCIFPFFKYHRLSTDILTIKNNFLNKQNVMRRVSLLKGNATYPTIEHTQNNYLDLSSQNSELPLTEKSLNYLYEVVDYCKNEVNTKVVFVRFPHRVLQGNDDYKRANRVGRIVKENGFEYLDFDKEKSSIGIENTNDFYDNDHMNIYGQIKFTDFLGKKLIDKYSIIPRQQTYQAREQWEKSVKYTDRFYQYVGDNMTYEYKEDPYFENYNTIERLSHEID